MQERELLLLLFLLYWRPTTLGLSPLYLAWKATVRAANYGESGRNDDEPLRCYRFSYLRCLSWPQQLTFRSTAATADTRDTCGREKADRCAPMFWLRKMFLICICIAVVKR